MSSKFRQPPLQAREAKMLSNFYLHRMLLPFCLPINRNRQSSLRLFCILSQLLYMKPLQTITILLYLLLPGFYKKANAQVQQTEARIDSLMHHYKMVGLSVAVVKKGRIIYTHAFGKKNIATGTP